MGIIFGGFLLLFGPLGGPLAAQEARVLAREKALADLKRECEDRWHQDSLWAREQGWPLQWGDASFAGRQGGLPRYEIPATRDEIFNYYGQELWAPPYLLRGVGQTIGQWEASSGGNTAPDTTNVNLNASNILLRNASGSSGHATSVALRLIGTAQGDSAGGLGLAPEAQLEAWSSSGVESTLAAEAGRYFVSNHSYATLRGWVPPRTLVLNGQTETVNWFSEANVDRQEDYGFGLYVHRDSVWDAIAYHAPFHNIVLAASNERGGNRTDDTVVSFYYDPNLPDFYRFEKYTSPRPEADGGLDGYDCLPPGTLSKNAWVIGATNASAGIGYQGPADEDINQRSAFGPSDDGRIKPDFVAPGGFTSFSAPQVSGSLALLQELAQAELGYPLRSATLKALMMHTAFDFAPAGPDYHSGWGLINPSAAAEILSGRLSRARFYEQELAPQSRQVFYLYLDSTADLRASMAWTDPPGRPNPRLYDSRDLNNTQSMLINDLNMRLYRLADQQSFLPLVLDPTQPALAAQPGDNTRDNSEQIRLPQASAGWYALTIDARANLLDDQGQPAPQAFSLVLSGFSHYHCSPEASYSAHWDGSQWNPAPPAAGDHVRISGQYQLSSDQYFGQLQIDPGASLDLEGHSLHLSGNLLAPEAAISGGPLYFDGLEQQELCGSCIAEQLYLDNSAGLQVIGESSALVIKDYLFLEKGRLLTGDALYLRGGESPRSYAQLHHESGADWQGLIHYQFNLPDPSPTGWRSLASPVSSHLGAFLRAQDDFALATGGSVFQWDARSSRWAVPQDTNRAFDALHPYWIFMGENQNTRFNSFPFSVELTGQSPLSVQQNLGYHDGTGGEFVTGSVDSAGWNLLSNPFPENLNWTAIRQHLDFSTPDSALHGAYYVWDPGSEKYLSHNGLVGDSVLGGSIAPMQAFFVKLNRAADTQSTAFDFDQSHRRLERADFRKSTPAHWQLSLSIEGSEEADRAYIAFYPQAKSGFDTRFDAYKLMGEPVSGPRLFTMPKQGIDQPALGIQCLPLPARGEKIPLALRAPFSGAAQIKSQAFQLSQPEEWYLVDRKTGQLQSLDGGSYFFDYQTGDDDHRFWIWRAPSQFERLAESAEFPVLWHYKEGHLQLKLSRWRDDLQVRLVNSAGQQVESYKGLSGLEWRFELNLIPGLYYLLLDQGDWHYSESIYLGY